MGGAPTPATRPEATRAVLDQSGAPPRDPPVLVVGFDCRAQSAAALLAAADLARRLGGALHVLHAVDLADYPADADSEDWEQAAGRLVERARRAAADALGPYDVPWSFELWRADASEALVQRAGELDALMVVVGSRGEGWRARAERVASHSVSHRVIERAGRPVLVVRSPGAASERATGE